MLAGLPVITAALHPVAGQVLASHTGQAWSLEHQPEQWAIDWRSAEDPAPLLRNPQEVLNRWVEEIRADEAQAAQDRPDSVYANVSGNWWSYWFRTTGRDGPWVIPDWQRIANEWDAVHLTTMGYLNTAGRALAVDADAATVLAGWDPDTTLWLTDVVREAEAPRQIWSRGPNDDTWARTA